MYKAVPLFRAGLAMAALVLGFAVLGFAICVSTASSAEARGGGHGFGHAFAASGYGGAHFEHGRRRGNDQYVKSSSNELDKLLTKKLKNICRGC